MKECCSSCGESDARLPVVEDDRDGCKPIPIADEPRREFRAARSGCLESSEVLPHHTRFGSGRGHTAQRTEEAAAQGRHDREAPWER